MRAIDTRTAGQFLLAERGGYDREPALELAIELPHPPATLPLYRCARIRSDALAYLARLCGVSVEGFTRRYN